LRSAAHLLPVLLGDWEREGDCDRCCHAYAERPKRSATGASRR
jgi:hypothetical protein